MRCITAVWAVVVVAANAGAAWSYSEACAGELCTQQFNLRPGWNAIYLEVQPLQDDPETVFQGVAVESAWTWNPVRGRVEYVQDPSEPALRETEFLGWFPRSRPESFLNNLQSIRGHRAYLVRLAGAATTLTVVGRPQVRSTRWIPDSFNFTGMPVDPNAPPSFASMFAESSAHAGQPIYRLGADGTWSLIASPAATPMLPGEAFWIWTQGGSAWSGPVGPVGVSNGGLDYANSADQLPLDVRNHRATNVPLGLEIGPSLIGRLRWSREASPDRVVFEWETLGPSLALTAGSLGVLTLRLGLQRADVDTELGGVLTVRGAGVRRWIPLRASPQGPSGGVGQTPDPLDPAGLWVGTITLDRVAEVHAAGTPQDPNTPYSPCGCGAQLAECSCVCGEVDDGDPGVITCRSCSQQLDLRVLVHVDGNGTARLLKEVVQACKDNPATEAACDQMVLLTDAADAAGLKGVARRGGELIPLRLSSASFDFAATTADQTRGRLMTTTGGFGPSGRVTTNLSLPMTHPTHPYRHAFHRDHDGQCGCAASDSACIALCAVRQNFDLTRDVEFLFDADDPAGDQRLDWRSRRLEGCYSETVKGMHRLPLHAGGRFTLTRVSTVSTLGAQ
jgi:hypothetical protein